MSLLRFLGVGASKPADAAETETVRRIASRLERLEPAQARYLAAFAYVLARVANADLRVEASESAAMERIVRRTAGLGEARASMKWTRFLPVARRPRTAMAGPRASPWPRQSRSGGMLVGLKLKSSS